MDIKKIKLILILSIVMMFLSSIVSAMAVSAYLYNSNEVSYNNNASGISSTNVQGAIDELYEHATDYTSMNTRVSVLEGRWTSEGKTLNVGRGQTGIVAVKLFNNDVERGSFYSSEAGATTVNSDAADGTFGQGKLELYGKPIKIDATRGGTGDINLNGNVKFNGTNVSTIEDITSQITFNVSVDSNYTYFYKYGNLVFFQVYFKTANASSTDVFTIPNSIKCSKQRWFVIAPAMGGTSTARLSISGNTASNVGATHSNDFVSGMYIIN